MTGGRSGCSLGCRDPGQQPELTFAGSNGEIIDVVATNVTTSDYGGCATVTLLNPQGVAFDSAPGTAAAARSR